VNPAALDGAWLDPCEVEGARLPGLEELDVNDQVERAPAL